MAALARPGIWKRDPFSLRIHGLDLTEAMASLRDRLDRDFACELFLQAELAFLAALIEKSSESDGK